MLDKNKPYNNLTELPINEIFIEKGWELDSIALVELNRNILFISSLKLTIKNPYFGDEMLTYVSVKETIDENFKNKKHNNKSSSINNHSH